MLLLPQRALVGAQMKILLSVTPHEINTSNPSQSCAAICVMPLCRGESLIVECRAYGMTGLSEEGKKG